MDGEKFQNGKKAVSGFFKKLAGIKNIKIIILIFIIAIALIIYSTVMTNKPKPTTSAMNSDEVRLSSILSGIDGAGDVETMITSQNGEIVGVLIVAKGADSITVRLRLIDATSSALGVDKDKISVYLKK